MTDQYGFKGDTPVGSRFLFEVDGVEIGVFGEVSGLEMKVNVEECQEGGQNGFVHQLPGRMTWPHIILKRGVTDSDALFSWVGKSSGDGFSANGNKLSRCTGAITIISSGGARERAWQLSDVFAVRWSGPSLSSSSGDPLQEELELAHHGFTSKTFS
ncbi:MAG TPA: phage tail protein [Acidimicrobiales bacterium]|nr:phage tail protein [Acidimicrobiales bacterium]